MGLLLSCSQSLVDIFAPIDGHIRLLRKHLVRISFRIVGALHLQSWPNLQDRRVVVKEVKHRGNSKSICDFSRSKNKLRPSLIGSLPDRQSEKKELALL